MTVLPTFPSTEVTFLGDLNGDAYDASSNPEGLAQGGHRQNFPEAMNDTATVASYIHDAAVAVQALAIQTSTDAASAAAGSGTEATATEIRSGTAAHYLSIRHTYDAMAPVALTDAASIAWDMSTGVNFSVTIGAAGRALANPTSQVPGKSGLLFVIQDGTGGRTITTWGANIKWVGGLPFWPTAPGAISVISYFVLASGTIVATFGGNS